MVVLALGFVAAEVPDVAGDPSGVAVDMFFEFDGAVPLATRLGAVFVVDEADEDFEFGEGLMEWVE